MNWFTLGIFLKVDFERLKTIETNHHHSLIHCRQEMLISWIRLGNASWDTLVNVLQSDDVKETAVAEKIKNMLAEKRNLTYVNSYHKSYSIIIIHNLHATIQFHFFFFVIKSQCNR